MTEDHHGRLEVIQHLRQHGLQDTVKKFSLRSHKHKKHPHLVQLHYDFQCKFKEAVHCECRGIIVDTSDPKFPIVCLPYTKFFNHGEKEAKSIDWKSAVVMEKLDGSIATLYHYRGEWFLSSSSVPDASSLLYTSQQPFADIFFEIWSKMNYVFPTDPTNVYMFEMLTAKNRIVCHVPEDMIVLHGVRSMITLKEERPEPVAAAHNWRVAPTHPVSSLKDCIALVKDRPPFEYEGVVVCDAQFRRVKVKSPGYTAVSLLSGQKHVTNFQRMLHVIRIGESSELLAYHPKLKPAHDRVHRAYSECVAELSQATPRKELGLIFMSWVQRVRSQKVLPQVALRDAELKDAWELVELFMDTRGTNDNGAADDGEEEDAAEVDAPSKKGPVEDSAPPKRGGKGQRGKKKQDNDLPECTGICCQPAAPLISNVDHSAPVPSAPTTSNLKPKKKKKGKKDSDSDDDGDTAPPSLTPVAEEVTVKKKKGK
jgi:hypothetical protein